MNRLKVQIPHRKSNFGNSFDRANEKYFSLQSPKAKMPQVKLINDSTYRKIGKKMKMHSK